MHAPKTHKFKNSLCMCLSTMWKLNQRTHSSTVKHTQQKHTRIFQQSVPNVSAVVYGAVVLGLNTWKRSLELDSCDWLFWELLTFKWYFTQGNRMNSSLIKIHNRFWTKTQSQLGCLQKPTIWTKSVKSLLKWRRHLPISRRHGLRKMLGLGCISVGRVFAWHAGEFQKTEYGVHTYNSST